MCYSNRSSNTVNTSKGVNLQASEIDPLKSAPDEVNLSAHPNPAEECVNISVSGSDNSELVVTDVLGKTLYSTLIHNKIVIKLPLTGIQQNVLFVRVIKYGKTLKAIKVLRK